VGGNVLVGMDVGKFVGVIVMVGTDIGRMVGKTVTIASELAGFTPVQLEMESKTKLTNNARLFDGDAIMFPYVGMPLSRSRVILLKLTT
jgi:hypothetical protein